MRRRPTDRLARYSEYLLLLTALCLIPVVLAGSGAVLVIFSVLALTSVLASLVLIFLALGRAVERRCEEAYWAGVAAGAENIEYVNELAQLHFPRRRPFGSLVQEAFVRGWRERNNPKGYR